MGPHSLEPQTLVELGAVGAPFGVRGWVKLRSYTEPQEGLLEHRRLHLKLGGRWAVYEVEAEGRSGGQLTAKLAGVDDRNAAELLRGAPIAVPRAELPPTDDRDFYRTDLIGCDVVNREGRRLGTLAHFVDIAAHALMVVRGEREYWVPAVPQYLLRVDLRTRQVVVDWEDPVD